MNATWTMLGKWSYFTGDKRVRNRLWRKAKRSCIKNGLNFMVTRTVNVAGKVRTEARGWFHKEGITDRMGWKPMVLKEAM